MGKLVNRYPSVIEEVVEGVESRHDLNTEWLIRKVIKEAKYELVKKPNETIKVRELQRINPIKKSDLQKFFFESLIQCRRNSPFLSNIT